MNTTKTENVTLQEAILIFSIFAILGGIISYDMIITQLNQQLTDLGMGTIYSLFPLLGSLNESLALTEQAKTNMQLINTTVVFLLIILLSIIVFTLYKYYKKRTATLTVRAK